MRSEDFRPRITSIVAIFILFLLISCGGEEKAKSRDKRASTSSIKDKPTEIRAERAEGWTMFLGDLSWSGRSNDKSISPPLKLAWKFMTSGPITASPVAWNDTVYIGSQGGRFYALKAKEWGEKWSFNAGSPIQYSGVIYDGRVFFHTRDNVVYALDAVSGELIWKVKMGNWISSPIVAYGGRLYLGVYDKKIYILDPKSGKIKGRASLKTNIGGVLYVCTQGNLRPLEPMNQVKGIRDKIPFSQSYPVIANGYIFIGSRKGALHVLSEMDRQEVFSFEVGGGVDSTPAIYDGMIYFGSLDGYVYALAGEDHPQPGSSKIEGEKGKCFVVGRSAVYDRPEGEILTYVNDGEILPFYESRDKWYKVKLPDGRFGWALSVMPIARYKDDLLLSDRVSEISLIKLKLGGEYPVWSPDGGYVAYPLRTNLQSQYWHADEIWITSGDSGESRKLISGSLYNPHLSWSLDGKWIAFETYDSNVSHIWVVSRDGKELRRVTKGEAPAFSPKAHRIAFRRRRELIDSLWVVNLDGSGLRRIHTLPILGTPQQYLYLLPPAWSPDGRVLALGANGEYYQSGDAKILLMGVEEGVESKIVHTRSKKVKEMIWSPDGRYLSYVLSGNPGVRPDAQIDERLFLLDMQTQKLISLNHTSPTWSPDGEALAFMEHDDRAGISWKVWIYNTGETRIKKRLLLVSRGDLTRLEWIPDGRLCLWVTGRYLRGGEFKPAQTIGYILRLKM
jgi:Tol biopolymer transport system component